LLLESDILIAYFKKEDWLKSVANGIINAIEDGRLKNVQVSTEVFHELYYVFSDFASLQTMFINGAKLATIKNLVFIKPSYENYLSAMNIMDTYNLTSIFDAIYAATALSSEVPDHIIVSTDRTFDKIRGLRRIDPRELQH